MASVVWGQAWQGKLIRFHLNNLAVVGAIGKRYSSKLVMMHLLHYLVFFAVNHSFWFLTEHLPGSCNQRADALSRDHMDEFWSLSLHRMRRSPIGNPREWTSKYWTQKFSNSIKSIFICPSQNYRFHLNLLNNYSNGCLLI